jgi:cytidylate kinase
MIVTIDGPAGAGKSSVSRQLAIRLGFRFLDTGAMYRAVALSAMENGIDLTDADALEQHARGLQIELTEDKTLCNGEDISSRIRHPDVTRMIHYVADHPAIRSQLVALQQQSVVGRHFVTEGRDQGTIAFPLAECKIYLTASPEERARRRLAELHNDKIEITLDEVLQDQIRRDHQDATRPVGALRQAEDAIEVYTDEMSTDQVVDFLEAIVRSRMEQIGEKAES